MVGAAGALVTMRVAAMQVSVSVWRQAEGTRVVMMAVQVWAAAAMEETVKEATAATAEQRAASEEEGASEVLEARVAGEEGEEGEEEAEARPAKAGGMRARAQAAPEQSSSLGPTSLGCSRRHPTPA